MKKLTDLKVRFVGAGNMATSLIGGLLKRGFLPSQITASDPGGHQRQIATEKFGVQTFGDNNSHFGIPDVVILAVKPQIIQQVALDISNSVAETNALVISIAAGIKIEHLEQWLADDTAIVRTMPNTPALIGEGATGLFANKNVTKQQRHLTEGIMDSVGISHWVDAEFKIDVVTALSGSGPAYFFLFMEYMQKTAIELGLSPEVAARLTEQTALGSAILAQRSADDITMLRQKVTSPNGTTEAALKSFDSNHLEQVIKQALTAANDRSIQLSKDFS
ncbi:Pyrroline-5-carboxylate reductase [hydrothermal vent metagenome]|uniref:Pyrroline-5-carboxylate reductase n=1 Tax=hydrothermal vent metagenome TaxID=652676 RepID=A0A3B0VYW8_9ZZZZ